MDKDLAGLANDEGVEACAKMMVGYPKEEDAAKQKYRAEPSEPGWIVSVGPWKGAGEEEVSEAKDD